MPNEQPTQIIVEAQQGRVGEVVDGVKKVAGIPADKLTLLAVIVISLAQLALLAYGAVIMAPKNAENMNIAGLRALQDQSERSDERLKNEREYNRAYQDRRDNRMEEFFKQQSELNRQAREQEFKLVISAYQTNTTELKELKNAIGELIKAINSKKMDELIQPFTVPDRPDTLRQRPDSSPRSTGGYCRARWPTPAL